MKKYWEVFWRLRMMHLMVMFEYRGDFIFWAFVSVMWTIFNFFFVNILVSSTGEIAGWNQAELFLLTSIYTIYDAFTWSFFYFNFQRYTSRVFSGELDAFLLKPIDTQYLLSTEHNSYNNLFRLFIGIGMLVYSLQQLEYSFNLTQILLATLSLSLGFLLIYSIWFFITTFSFWVDKLDNINDIIPSLRRLYQLPRGVYSGLSSLIFCVLLPIVLITNIPAEILTGRGSVSWTLYFLVITFTFFILSRKFFHFSLKKYGSAGS